MKIVKLFPLMLLMFMACMTMTSCSEEDDTVEEYANWQVVNETRFQQLSDSVKLLLAENPDRKDWKRLKCWAKMTEEEGADTDYILVKVLGEGDAAASDMPLYTDSVSVHYQGRLLPSHSYAEGYVFDQSYYGTFNPDLCLPSKMQLNTLISGFTTAVMNMHRGDHWLVYIPHQLGYGATATAIPAYSLLIFDIALVDFWPLQ